MDGNLIQHLMITEIGLIKGGLHLSYKGNQNIFNNFNALSADFLRAACVLNPTVNPVYWTKVVERIQRRFGRLQDEA